jgi:hypothetical protein
MCDSVCNGSSLTGTSTSENSYGPRYAFGRSALLFIKGGKNVGHCPIVPSPYDNIIGTSQERTGLQS